MENKFNNKNSIHTKLVLIIFQHKKTIRKANGLYD